MRLPRHKRILLLLPLLAVCAGLAKAQDDQSQLERMLQGQQFDPNLLVEEANEGDSGTFEPRRPSSGDETFRQGRVAMVLPNKHGGLAGNASRALQLGFQHAAEVENDFIELSIYSTDGSLEDVLLSYDHATQSGADLVVGPMLKGNVRELLQTRRDAEVTTLVTQPVDVFGFDDSKFFGVSIGYEAEAKMIAQTALDAGLVSGAIVVEDGTAFGRRVSDSFAREWEKLTNSSPRKIVAGTQEQLVEMHETLKDIAKASVESDSTYWPLVFAAGNREFVLKVRAHAPGLLALHALSLVNEADRVAGGEDVSVLGMDNVHVVEMPWVVEPNSVLATRYAWPDIRGKSLIEQRFFALGIDIYRLSMQRICWKVGCSTEGVAGTWKIGKDEHNFRRTGVPANFESGILKVADR